MYALDLNVHKLSLSFRQSLTINDDVKSEQAGPQTQTENIPGSNTSAEKTEGAERAGDAGERDTVDTRVDQRRQGVLPQRRDERVRMEGSR